VQFDAHIINILINKQSRIYIYSAFFFIIAATLIAAAIIMTAIWQPPYPCSWPIQDIIEPYFTFCEKPEDTKPSNKQVFT
jgi:hypothetical protein